MFQWGKDDDAIVDVNSNEEITIKQLAGRGFNCISSVLRLGAKGTLAHPTFENRSSSSNSNNSGSSGTGGDSKGWRAASPRRLWKAFNSWTAQHQAAVEALVDGPWV